MNAAATPRKNYLTHLEDWHSMLAADHGQCIFAAIFVLNREHTAYFVSQNDQLFEHIGSELTLSDDGDFHFERKPIVCRQTKTSVTIEEFLLLHSCKFNLSLFAVKRICLTTVWRPKLHAHTHEFTMCMSLLVFYM